MAPLTWFVRLPKDPAGQSRWFSDNLDLGTAELPPHFSSAYKL